MRTAKTLFASALFLLASPFALAEGTDSLLLRQVVPDVLKVETANADGSVSFGSGVVLGGGVVATNCHVTQRALSVTLVRGGFRAEVASESSDVEHDLCLLYSPSMRDLPAAVLSSDLAHRGEGVFAVGFGGGGAVRVSDGRIEGVFEFDGGQVIQTSARFASGASGGGLFDEQGRLVGILSFMSRGPNARHYCLPASWVARAAAQFDGRPVAPLTGVPFWQEAAERQPEFLRTAAAEDTADGR